MSLTPLLPPPVSGDGASLVAAAGSIPIAFASRAESADVEWRQPGRLNAAHASDRSAA
jgi:hypothetical protein